MQLCSSKGGLTRGNVGPVRRRLRGIRRRFKYVQTGFNSYLIDEASHTRLDCTRFRAVVVIFIAKKNTKQFNYVAFADLSAHSADGHPKHPISRTPECMSLDPGSRKTSYVASEHLVPSSKFRVAATRHFILSALWFAVSEHSKLSLREIYMLATGWTDEISCTKYAWSKFTRAKITSTSKTQAKRTTLGNCLQHKSTNALASVSPSSHDAEAILSLRHSRLPLYLRLPRVA